MLTGRGDSVPASQSSSASDDLAASVALNCALCLRSRYSTGANHLAAPRIGAAIPMGRVQQLVLLAIWGGAKDVEATVWGWLSAQDERLVRHGETLATPEDNLAEIAVIHADVVARLLPLLKRLGGAAAVDAGEAVKIG